jgi:hypothetical protein
MVLFIRQFMKRKISSQTSLSIWVCHLTNLFTRLHAPFAVWITRMFFDIFQESMCRRFTHHCWQKNWQSMPFDQYTWCFHEFILRPNLQGNLGIVVYVYRAITNGSLMSDSELGHSARGWPELTTGAFKQWRTIPVHIQSDLSLDISVIQV